MKKLTELHILLLTLTAKLQKYGKSVQEGLILIGFSKNNKLGSWRKKMSSKASKNADGVVAQSRIKI